MVIGGRARGRKALVVAQLAVTMVLLVGAGLFVETLTRLRARGDEFAAHHLVLFKANPPALGYPEGVRQVLFGAIIVAVAAAYTRVTGES